MKCANANNLLLQVSNTLASIDSAVSTGISSDNEAYLARYAAVYITGIYEQSIEEILWEYASDVGNAELENFVANQLNKNFRNPDMGNIIHIVGQFSSSWAAQIKAMDSRYRTAMDSIINNKNHIAHGETSLITVSDIKAYHSDAIKIIEKIDELFLGV